LVLLVALHAVQLLNPFQRQAIGMPVRQTDVKKGSFVQSKASGFARQFF